VFARTQIGYDKALIDRGLRSVNCDQHAPCHLYVPASISCLSSSVHEFVSMGDHTRLVDGPIAKLQQSSS